MLVTDAWFDIILESHADELRISIMLAFFAELPVAALCFWIAYRTEQFLARVVDQASHFSAADERPAEGDLVGVLKIAADGKPAGQPRHPDATS